MPLKERNFRLFLPYVIACIALLVVFFSYKPRSGLELPHVKAININTGGVKIEHIENLYYEQLPNPFIAKERTERSIVQRGTTITSPRHILSLIIIGNKKMCIIDGKTMRVGEKKNGLKVLEIERNSVIVLENGKKGRLNIK